MTAFPRTQSASAPAVALPPNISRMNNSASVARVQEGDYETVAAGQTAQVLGTAGAAGDMISHVLVIPASKSPGAIVLIDNATSITIFAGGTDCLTGLVPFAIPLGMVSRNGPWKLTTGADVSCVAVGSFS